MPDWFSDGREDYSHGSGAPNSVESDPVQVRGSNHFVTLFHHQSTNIHVNSGLTQAQLSPIVKTPGQLQPDPRNNPFQSVLEPSIPCESMKDSLMKNGGLALKMMQAQGWQEGQGLGKSNHGVCEPVKASMKFDQSGLGHDRAQEFTHHWWDIAFNKAAQTIQVTQDEHGELNLNMERKLTKKEKQTRKRKAKRDMYAQFVQAATLSNGDLVPTRPDSDVSGDERDQAEAEALDRLAQAKALNLLTDEELFQACGGLTAHKGARHGHNMTAKHNRVAAMEAQYMADMAAKAAQLPRAQNGTPPPHTPHLGGPNLVEEEGKKKKKKKSKKSQKEFVEPVVEAKLSVMSPPATEVIKRKKRKRDVLTEEAVDQPPLAEGSAKKKKKKKKSKKIKTN